MADENNSSNQSWTVARVLRWVTSDLRERGVESPRLEAELLVAHVLDCDRIQLILDPDRPLDQKEREKLRELVARRRKHEPVAYLRGEREFYGLPLQVDHRVLIPRPDTETLVETALELSQHRYLHGKLLDLCTGSGNVAIAFCKQRPTWEVTATDLSTEALEVARRNFERLCDLWNVRLAAGDLFEAVGRAGKFHLITGNPPYIPTQEVERLDPTIREHEPRLALDGGSDGLAIVRRIVQEAPDYLVPGGWLLLEIGSDQGEVVKELFRQAGFVQARVVPDLAGRDRVVIGRKPVEESA